MSHRLNSAANRKLHRPAGQARTTASRTCSHGQIGRATAADMASPPGEPAVGRLIRPQRVATGSRYRRRLVE